MWWIIALLLVLVALFCYQLFGPNPPIIVSRETTYITEPLRADGLPDYEKYVLEMYRKGVAPENNAAVLLWQAMGPGEIDRRYWPVVAKELGANVPSEDQVMTQLHGPANKKCIADWLDKNVPQWRNAEDNIEFTDEPSNAPNDTDVDAVIDRAISMPWRSEQLPPLAEFLIANQSNLELLIEASERPRFYSPSSSLLSEPGTGLAMMMLGGVQPTRAAVRALSVQAMWHLGERRHAAAWDSLHAIFLWARLIEQGGTVVEQLVASSIDRIASSQTATLLGDDGMPPGLARQIHFDLSSVTPVSRMADAFESERLMFVDCAVRGSDHGANRFLHELDETIANGIFVRPIDHVSFDWNVVLATGNQWFDRLVAAARLSEWREREDALQRVYDDLAVTEDASLSSSQLTRGILNRQSRSKWLAAMALKRFLPATESTHLTYDLQKAGLQLVQLSAALADFRSRHGEYPATLEMLVPEILPTLPVDLYHFKQFVYCRDGAGYLLYSVGKNGRDDGGSCENWRGIDGSIFAGHRLDFLDDDEVDEMRNQIPDGADDIAIRVPRPDFVLPKFAPSSIQP